MTCQRRNEVMGARSGRAVAWLLLAGLLLPGAGGCAAFTNPVSNGVPVSRLPDEFKGQSREEAVSVPITLLRKPKVKEYRVEPGDILGIYIENVLGGENLPPPVQIAEGRLPPSIGFPFVVRQDGTISLPLVPPIKAAGLTLPEIEKEVLEAYTVKRKILREGGDDKIIVTLQRQHVNQILVIREDQGAQSTLGGFAAGNSKRGSGFVLDLPADESDVATALARTGGLPGLDARNEVIIQRGQLKPGPDGKIIMPDLRTLKPVHIDSEEDELRTTRIPLRLRPGEAVPFRPDDIALKTGDVVFIQTRETELFYTAGILQPREVPLPRDYDLDVLEALVITAAPLINGGIAGNFIQGSIVGNGVGNPTPTNLTIVRRLPGANGDLRIHVDLNRAFRDPRERILIQPNDILVLQETIGEAFTRYLTQRFSFNANTTIMRTPSAFIGGNAFAP